MEFGGREAEIFTGIEEAFSEILEPHGTWCHTSSMCGYVFAFRSTVIICIHLQPSRAEPGMAFVVCDLGLSTLCFSKQFFMGCRFSGAEAFPVELKIS